MPSETLQTSLLTLQDPENKNTELAHARPPAQLNAMMQVPGPHMVTNFLQVPCDGVITFKLLMLLLHIHVLLVHMQESLNEAHNALYSVLAGG